MIQNSCPRAMLRVVRIWIRMVTMPDSLTNYCPIWSPKWGAGIAQWLEHRTCDQKVVGSNPCRSGGINFFSRSAFCADSYFGIRSTPVLRQQHVEDPGHSATKCRWQVTAKYVCTLRMWLCMKWHGAWLCGVHRTRRDGSSCMWHQPCQRCKYTTSVDIKNNI